MEIKSVIVALSVFTMASAPLSAALADEALPAGAKPLSSILTSVQNLGIGNIVEAEFDDGRWEIAACTSASMCQMLYINPHTGMEEGRKSTDFEETPAAGATPIEAVVQRVEAANIGMVHAIDFDRGHWKVELSIPSEDGR